MIPHVKILCIPTLLLIFGFLPIQNQIQKVQLSTLFLLFKLDRDQIDDFAVSKGYAIWPTRTLSPSLKIISYLPKADAIYRSITLKYYNDNILTETGYTTTDKLEYVSLKTQIKSKSYRFVSSEVIEDELTTHTYKSEKTPNYVIQISQSHNQETGDNHYTITVQRMR